MSFRFQHNERPLEGYTIQRGVGRGGFGEVYHALSDGGKEVALKYLRDHPQVELRGVMHCLNLKSPHLITLYDVRQNASGDWFVIMEYVNGVSLRDLLMAEPRGLGVEKAVYFLREIGRGLSYLHSRGIVHRDLKPGNIFFDEGMVKIGDYGLSKAIAASQHSGQTMSVGTVHYMAPEIGSGDYNKTIDLYALGVMLYEMLLGRLPFEGSSMGEILMKHLTAQPEVDGLPAPFPAVIRRALAKDPAARYQSVEEMVSEVMGNADLARSLAGFDSLSLTRVAERAVAGVMVHAGGGGSASSNTNSLDARHPSPPPIMRPSGGDRIRQPMPPHGFAPHVPGGIQYMQTDEPFSPRSRLIAGLLGITLGSIGVHRFYLGFTGIGILQMLSCFTGIGALWGLAEGIIILANGPFTDALGRPLTDGYLSSRPARSPGHRAMVLRILWGVFGAAVGIGSLIAAGGATFGDPDMQRISMGLAQPAYHIDTIRLLYMLASGLGALSCFALWKAGHRGDLPLWQSTIRPALMCLMLAIGGVGLTFDLAVAAGRFQLVGIGAVVAAMLGFTVLWLLRGPDVKPQPDDAYWSMSWLRVFQVLAVVGMVGLVVGLKAWRDAGEDHLGLYRPGTTVLTQIRMKAHYWDAVERDFLIPTIRYQHEPIAVLACALLTVGSAAEVVSRRRRLAANRHA